ncbi:hypothetical protein [Telluribacter sp. SYSU D00476]|uniref:hypothetical protein n=1 Tax=Telluribacter sp. SYSU D00476 TaxID=2811430 RepID=UPI001FF38752|nr:hypothetical protein [Telluribacter sp. SYSU D00476]
MKRKAYTWSGWASFLLLFILLFNTIGCNLLVDRTTTAHGRVTDEAGNPVDSVIVGMFSAGFGKTGIPLGETLTDKEGKYSLAVDVPRGYSTTTVGVPLGYNPKILGKYKSWRVSQNGQRINNCCYAPIGEKSNYDFMLLLK